MSKQDPNVYLFYLLARDYLPVSVVEQLVDQVRSANNSDLINFTNTGLSEWADSLAQKLKGITDDPAEIGMLNVPPKWLDQLDDALSEEDEGEVLGLPSTIL